MPHGPYYYDSLGKENPYEKIKDYSTWGNKVLFVSYIKYTNRIIRSVLNDLVQHDPASIIILMSDHGYRDYADNRYYQPSRFDNICAIRFSGSIPAHLNDRRSNVNLFRYIFNAAFGQQLPYLADSSIALQN